MEYSYLYYTTIFIVIIYMDYTALGKRIRIHRKMRGLTQEKLAEMADISPAFVGHIERGTRKLSVATLLSIAQALDCSIDYLLDNACAKTNAYIQALQHVADFVQREIDKTPRE